jgi:RNA polymerase sigma-B factor
MTGAGEQRRRLIETHLPLTQHVARRYARRAEQTEELAQVGALALVRAVDRCDPEREQLPAYLARCVEGEVRHYLRDRAAVVRIPRAAVPAPAIVSLDDDVADDRAALDDALLDRAALVAALRDLDARERLIVLLVFFYDRTQAEAATEIGISQPHVSRLLKGAMRKLRRRMAAGALSQTPEGATLSSDGERRRQDART